ncbi:MAG: TSUP family transporter [Firmicutes bacterium]|nr:TSUP family transporter [Bacillota bacterium]
MIFIDITAAALLAVLSGMGVGGGGLLVIYLTLVRGTDQLTAQGINLIFFICAAAASLLFRFKNSRFKPGVFLSCVIPGALCAYLGSLAAALVDPGIVRTAFGSLMIISGAAVLFKK